jgi:hypothetical protein
MQKPQSHPEEAINLKQAKKLLQYIDTSQSEEVKERIFSQLGRECFYTRKLDAWVESFQGDVQAFLDRVNIQQASKYWERLGFTEDGTKLILTGRKVTGCACGFADCAQPPLSLCHSCCKSFQEALFGKLLGRKVAVEIGASYLLGDDRCSTTIHIVDEERI